MCQLFHSERIITCTLSEGKFKIINQAEIIYWRSNIHEDEVTFVGGISERRPKSDRFVSSYFLFVGHSTYILVLVVAFLL